MQQLPLVIHGELDVAQLNKQLRVQVLTSGRCPSVRPILSLENIDSEVELKKSSVLEVDSLTVVNTKVSSPIVGNGVVVVPVMPLECE